MHSRKRRKAGFAPVKRYVDGGVMDCPNPPCPPPSPDRVKSLIDSGMWKLGPNGELLRLSAEEIDRDNRANQSLMYEDISLPSDKTSVYMPSPLDMPALMPDISPTDQGTIRPEPQGVPPNAAWMYQSMPAFQNPGGMKAAAKWTEENPLSSPQGLNLVGMLNSIGIRALALPVPGTSHIGGGLTLGDVFSAYFLKEGVQGLREDVPEFRESPSLKGAVDIGIDVLQTLPGAAGLYQNVVKPSAELTRAWRNYIGPFVQDAETINLGEAVVVGERAAAPQTAGFTDPVKEIIGSGINKAKESFKVVKKPSIPVMDEARIQAQMAVIRDQYNIPYEDIVDGTPNNLERYRQQAVEQLVGKNASSEAIARAEEQIDAAIESYMPTAIEDVMKNSEGNILNIPNDTRRPELDRVRMRFLNPNSKIWQQANKEGMIPTNNLVQLMKSDGMSDMEKGVLEEAIFGSPIYDKSGNLLGGEEARKAQDAVMSAILRAGGTEVKEFASGDISKYRINLNQLKGLSEMTSMTSSPIRSFALNTDPGYHFGSKIGVRKDEFKGNTYSNYGLNRIGYNDADSKTFVVGSDDFSSGVNHFDRGELSHFRVFTNDAPPLLNRNFPGTEIDVPSEFASIRVGRSMGRNLGTQGAYLNWVQDMSRVPGDLGYRRGGNMDMPLGDEGISESVSALLSGQTFLDDVTGSLRRGLNSLNDINRSASGIVRNIRGVQNRAADVSKGRGSLVGPAGDSSIRQLLEFANLPNRRELVINAMGDDAFATQINSRLDNLVESVSKEQEALARLGEAPVYKDTPGNEMARLDGAAEYLSLNSDIYFDLAKNTPFHRVKDNFRDYDNIIDRANSDFSFGSWSDSDLAEALGTLEGDVIPMAKNRFISKLENQIADLDNTLLKPNIPPQVLAAAKNLRLKLAEVKDIGRESFESMQNLAEEIFDLHDSLRGEYLSASQRAAERGVPHNIRMKTAVEEVEPKFKDSIDRLKMLILELEANRNNAALDLRDAAESMNRMSDDVVRSLPDLYESAKGELKSRIDNALQDQTALDYYDILQAQTRIQTEAGKVREYVMSGDINNPTLNKIFLETPDADRFYVSEIQSDFVQKSSGGKSGEIPVRSSTIDNKKVTRRGERMELDSFQKNWRTKTIQQAVLQGRKAGKNEILFPTYKTADKIQGWSGSKDTGTAGAGNRITYQGMDKHIRKATGIKPYKVVDPQGNEWWAIQLDPNQKYEFPDFKHGGRFRLRKR